jgi:hypothetical protein
LIEFAVFEAIYPGADTIIMSQQFTPADVAQYNGAKGLYIIVDSNVYNVTGMLPFLLFALLSLAPLPVSAIQYGAPHSMTRR